MPYLECWVVHGSLISVTVIVQGCFCFGQPSLIDLIYHTYLLYIMHTVGAGSRYEYGNYFTKSFTETSLSFSLCSLA